MNNRRKNRLTSVPFQWRGIILLLQIGVVTMAHAQGEAQDASNIILAKTDEGGYACKTESYSAVVDKNGSLQSIRSGSTEFLGAPTGLAHAGQFIRPTSVKQTAPDTLVAEGDPKDPAKAVAGSPCPFNVRITYHFLPDRIEMTLEQSVDLYGNFAWIPSSSVETCRDSLTDCPVRPGGQAPYGQTDPRWTTKDGAVLRFDFGVWQKGFANAYWSAATVDGKSVPFLQSTVPATAAMKAVVCPLSHPGPGDALTFDISAVSPDFLLPGKEPVHFDIKVTNTGPGPVDTTVHFEVRDYLTQQVVASKATRVELGSKGETVLPTDLSLSAPGPYRGAIVVEDMGIKARSFWWVFTYDFQHYEPKTTRQTDFKKFWKDALAESAATPLDVKMTRVPEKCTDTVDAFKVSYATLGGRRIYGWYARPKAPGKYPAQVRYPSSGIYPLAGPEAAADRCCLWILIHGFDVDLSNMPTGDDPGKNYWTAGIESPKTSMWRTIYISLVRAVDFMVAQPEVDPKRVAVTGGSQGGGLSMAAAGLDPRIGFCMPSHNGLPRLDWTVKYEPGYWPFGMGAKPKGQTEEQFLTTLSYFDAANFTQDIQCPVVAAVGMMDTVTAAGNQICAVAHVPKGQLYLICSPWAMHGAGARGLAPGFPGPEECYEKFRKGEKQTFPPTKP